MSLHQLRSLIDDALSRVDFRLSRFPRELRGKPHQQLEVGVRHAIAECVLSRVSSDSEFVFLQIGAHEAEGDAEPTLLSSGCRRRGVLVEPQPQLAALLRRKFESEQSIRVMECAIGETRGSLPFYRVDDPNHELPEWLSQVASFDRAHIEKFLPQAPSLRRHITELCVAVETPDQICRSASIDRLDLLMVDVEGWDWQVIRLFPFERIPVRLVVFEHRHLSRKDRRAALARLIDLGFQVQVLASDVIAMSPRKDLGRGC